MSGHRRRLKPKFDDERQKYQESFEKDLELGILEKVETIGTLKQVSQKLAENPQYFNNISLPNGKPCCYMPHQAVYKKSSGKFRRVHDGKARPFKGAYSLNDTLEKGPNLMSNILHILIGFRKERYACKADIEKAFPQVVIHPDDRDVLRCLWFEGDQIAVYRFARLPFGISPSPMILAATLIKHLGENNIDEKTKQNFIASLYVDDSVWSEELIEELYKRKDFYTKIFKDAGMNFREWTSNYPEARKIFGDEENRVPPLEEKVLGIKWDLENDKITINSDNLQEVLSKKLRTKRHLWKLVPSVYDPLGLLAPYTIRGRLIISKACEEVKGWDSQLPQEFVDKALSWASEFDQVESAVFDRHAGISSPKKLRLIGCCDASSIAYGACVYLLSTDENGVVTSNLIVAKARVAPKIKHSIPRMELLSAVLLNNVMGHARITYSDIPSEDIYWFMDSAILIFWLYSGHMSWRPFVANQLKTIKKNSIVTNWIHIDTSENPADLPSRGAHLNELADSSFWAHGPEFWKKDLYLDGKSKLSGYDKHYQNLEMPKECKNEMRSELKRELGVEKVTVSSIIEKTGFAPKTEVSVNALDLSVFSIFKENFSCSVVKTSAEALDLAIPSLQIKSTFLEENKTIANSAVIAASIKSPKNVSFPEIDNFIEDLEKCAQKDYDRLMTVTDHFVNGAKAFRSIVRRRTTTESNSQEKSDLLHKNSEVLWIRAIQRKHFPEIFKLIKDPKSAVSASSRALFINHSIFLDKDLKVLRCRTRNENSCLDFSNIYPILLPSMVLNKHGEREMCNFTKLLVKKAHRNVGHAGVPNTLAHLRLEFWVIQGRRFVQKVLKDCVACKKVQGPAYSIPPAPPLPEFRVNRDRPFHGTGLDFLGPFWCQDGRAKKYKVWYILFTCGSTRAIHLEAVKSRSVDDFIRALTRFMNECGIPSCLISDHEKCLVRTSKELEQIANSKRVKKFLKEKRISWSFYTEKSPNKGGFVERLNMSVKKTFYKVLGRKPVTFEDFRTMATTATSTINDRPLTYIYSDINSEYKALSPNMLIFGYNKGEPPYLDAGKKSDPSETKVSDMYLHLNKLRDTFWNLWSKYYLNELNERHIRQKKSNQELIVPKLGEICLIQEGKQPRREWRVCRIVDINQKRGSVRECTVQLLSPGGGLITKLKRSPQQLIPLEIPVTEIQVNSEDLVPLEGDPRICPKVLRKPPNTKYSKKELSVMKKAKIWPPYKRSVQFLDPSSINTGPEKDFVAKESSFRNYKKVNFSSEVDMISI